MVQWWLVVLLAPSWTWLTQCKCTFKEVAADHLKAENTILANSLNFPLIVKGGFKELTARGSSMEDFIRNVGSASMAFSANVEFQSRHGLKAEMFRMTVEEWIRSLSHESGALPKYVFSFLQDVEHRALDTRLLEVYPLPHYLQPWSVNRFIVIGSQSKGIALHQHGFSWVGLLAGRKRWVVFPPDAKLPKDISYKYHSWNKLKKIPQVEFCAQEASDLVLIPDMWWHTTLDDDRWTVGLGSQNMDFSATLLSWEVSTGNLSALRSTVFEADEELLRLASQSGHGEVVEFLLRKNAPIGNSMLAAAGNGHLQIVETLIFHRASATESDDSGMGEMDEMSPLSKSVLGGRSQCLEFLLRLRADVNVLSWGRSQLDVAAELGHTEVAQVLIKAGVNTTGLNYEGFAPIHTAALVGHSMVVRTLLDIGVEPAIRTSSGADVHQIAFHSGHRSVLDVLARKGPQTGNPLSEL